MGKLNVGSSIGYRMFLCVCVGREDIVSLSKKNTTYIAILLIYGFLGANCGVILIFLDIYYM